MVASEQYWLTGLKSRLREIATGELPNDQRPDGSLLFDDLGQVLLDAFGGRLEDQSQTPEAVDDARRTCLQTGDPFPLLALQWPHLVVDDPDEAAIFRKHLDPLRFSGVTERVRRACLTPRETTLRLDWWQMLTIAAFFDDTISEIYIKGCTGAGKGGSTAIAVNLWFDVFSQSRVTLTSESFEHALKNIYGEVVKWRKTMTHPQPASVLTESITADERHYIVVRNPRKDSGEAFSGQHGPGTLYLFDEATATPKILRDNCEKNATKIVALANPRTLVSWFREGFEPLGRASMDSIGVCYGSIGKRLCVTVGGLDCINVAEGRLRKPVAPRGGIAIDGREYPQGETIPHDDYQRVRALIPDQIDLNLFRANCAKDDPREVAIYAHGKFPDEDPTKQVILSSWLQRHIDYWHEIKGDVPIQAFGLDVARSFHGDATVLTPGGKIGVRDLHEFRIPNVVSIAQYVLQYVAQRYGINLRERRHPVCIDYAGGYGSGVGDVLQRAGVWVIPFQPSGRSDFPEWYTNLRTQSYGLLGRRLDPQHQFGATAWALPPNQHLMEELTAPEKVWASDAIRFGVEPKENIKEKLRGRSPDKADSVTYLFHAVSIIENYHELVRSLQGPLAIWPAAATESDKVKARAIPLPPDEERSDAYEIDLGLNRSSVEPVKPVNPCDGANDSPVGSRVADLLEFYRNEYGSR